MMSDIASTSLSLHKKLLNTKRLQANHNSNIVKEDIAKSDDDDEEEDDDNNADDKEDEKDLRKQRRNAKHRQKKTTENTSRLEEFSTSTFKLMKHINFLLRIILDIIERKIDVGLTNIQPDTKRTTLADAIAEYIEILAAAEVTEEYRHLCLENEVVTFFNSASFTIVPRKKRIKLAGTSSRAEDPRKKRIKVADDSKLKQTQK